jgi:hypothetical protein
MKRKSKLSIMAVLGDTRSSTTKPHPTSSRRSQPLRLRTRVSRGSKGEGPHLPPVPEALNGASACVGGERKCRPGLKSDYAMQKPPIIEAAISTMPGFFVVHETEYARKLIEAEVACLPFPFAMFIFGVPVSQEDVPVFGREVAFTNRTSKLRVQWRLRPLQMRDRIQAVHQRPPCGTKKQSSTPVNLLMNSTGV